MLTFYANAAQCKEPIKLVDAIEARLKDAAPSHISVLLSTRPEAQGSPAQRFCSSSFELMTARLSELARVGCNSYRRYPITPNHLLLIIANEVDRERLSIILCEECKALERNLLSISATTAPSPCLHDLKEDLPNFLTFVNALRNNEDIEYLQRAAEGITHHVSAAARYPKQLRSLIGPLARILTYYPEQDSLVAKLEADLRTHLEQLDRADNPSEVLIRQIDAYLHLIFALVHQVDDNTATEAMRDAVSALATRSLSAALACRAFRSNYVKAHQLMCLETTLIDLLQTTDSDDSHSALLLLQILSGQEQDSEGGELVKKMSQHLPRLSEKGLARLARDLRRANPKKKKLSSSEKSDLIDLLHSLSCKFGPETFFNILLIIHYSGLSSPSILKTFLTNKSIVLLSALHAAVLHTVYGYDVIFVKELNKALISAGYHYTVPAPSRFNTLECFMRTSVANWEQRRSHFSSAVSCIDSSSPLITVVMVSRNPNIHLLECSLRSISQQTHQHLRLIFVDDHSAESTSRTIRSLLQSLPLLSNKFQYLRNDSRLGPYASRNIALGYCTSDYITVHDDDDISHPQRFERQISALEARRELVATHCYHVRISPSSTIMIDGDSTHEIYGDCPVSFIWRSHVFDRVGLFLPAASRADLEFWRRIERVYTKEAIHRIQQPLLFVRGSLQTVSSSVEHSVNASLEAFREVMKNTPLRQVSERDGLRWIPYNLRRQSD